MCGKHEQFRCGNVLSHVRKNTNGSGAEMIFHIFAQHERAKNIQYLRNAVAKVSSLQLAQTAARRVAFGDAIPLRGIGKRSLPPGGGLGELRLRRRKET
jgi:hypothetical protein